jgi:hypothetical protein
MQSPQWRTTALRLVAAYAVGPVVGLVAFMIGTFLFYGPSAFTPSPSEGGADENSGTLMFTVVVGVPLLWATGLILVGGPIWYLLHSLRLNGPLPFVGTAALTGALAACLLWRMPMAEGPGYPSLAYMMTIGGGGALLVGLAMWRLAYRRVRPAASPAPVAADQAAVTPG